MPPTQSVYTKCILLCFSFKRKHKGVRYFNNMWKYAHIPYPNAMGKERLSENREVKQGATLCIHGIMVYANIMENTKIKNTTLSVWFIQNGCYSLTDFYYSNSLQSANKELY